MDLGFRVNGSVGQEPNVVQGLVVVASLKLRTAKPPTPKPESPFKVEAPNLKGRGFRSPRARSAVLLATARFATNSPSV